MTSRLLLLVVPTAMGVYLALTLPRGGNPDELDHLEGIRYFEQHWWPPDLNADELWYSAHGWNRVYTGEWVYWALGRGAALAGLTSQEPADYRLIRLLNVGALPFLLASLVCWPSRLFRLDVCALFVASIPQVIYVCAYVNGDAWALAMAGVLLRAGLSIYEDPSRARWWTFGSLIGLTILSKPNAWPLIPLACGLAWAGWCRDHARSWRRLAGVAVLAVVVAAPPWAPGVLSASLHELS